MQQEIAPIAVRPSTLNGISERMIASHYENHCGESVRTLNAVRAELAALDARASSWRLPERADVERLREPMSMRQRAVRPHAAFMELIFSISNGGLR